jgi:toxin ParE1/3/4
MAATRRIAWAPAAKQDLLSLWRYYSKVASSEIADKLVGEIEAASNRLRTLPLLGRTRDEVAPGLRSLIVHPYTVFYRIKDDAVEIVRVLHEHRDFATAFATKSRDQG